MTSSSSKGYHAYLYGLLSGLFRVPPPCCYCWNISNLTEDSKFVGFFLYIHSQIITEMRTGSSETWILLIYGVCSRGRGKDKDIREMSMQNGSYQLILKLSWNWFTTFYPLFSHCHLSFCVSFCFSSSRLCKDFWKYSPLLSLHPKMHPKMTCGTELWAKSNPTQDM